MSIRKNEDEQKLKTLQMHRLARRLPNIQVKHDKYFNSIQYLLQIPAMDR